MNREKKYCISAADKRKQGLGRRLYEVLEKKLARMGILNLYACIGYPEVPDEYLTKKQCRVSCSYGLC